MNEAKDLRQPGQRLWFEYHCNESVDSAHFFLWQRTHQQVDVIKLDPNGEEPEPGSTLIERCENGMCCCYIVRFDDGLETTVFEDELLNSPEQFCRPDFPSEVTHGH